MTDPADGISTAGERQGEGEESPPPAGPRHAAFSFSLRSLLLLMTLAAPVAALAAINHYLGIFLAVVLVYALLRTKVLIRNMEAQGQDVTDRQKLGLLANSLGRIAGVVIATILFAIIQVWISLLTKGHIFDSYQRYFNIIIGCCFSVLLSLSYIFYLGTFFRHEIKTLRRETPEQPDDSFP